MLQRDGYADTFRDSAIQDAITDGAIGSIAVQLIYWSGPSLQTPAVDWTLLESAADANAFADAITGASRPSAFGTAPGSAINFGIPLFQDNGFEGDQAANGCFW